MKFTHRVIPIIIATAALIVGSLSVSVTAQAATKKNTGFTVTQFTQEKRYQTYTYHKVSSNQGVRVYQNRYLKKYVTSKKTQTFTSHLQVTVQKSTGNKAIYRYVSSKSGKVKGWIARTNLSPKTKTGKVTSLDNQVIPVPTTTTAAARKTQITPLEKTSNDPVVATDTQDVWTITDAVSNQNFYGMKNVATLRDRINQLGATLKNHPAAWDAFYKQRNYSNHADAYGLVASDYVFLFNTYVHQVKMGNQVMKYGNTLKGQAGVDQMLKLANYHLSHAQIN